MRVTQGDITRFIFPPYKTISEILWGDEILNWMDEQIKISAAIEFELIEIRRDEELAYSLSYKVNTLLTVNPIYAMKHVAMKEVNLS